MFSRLLCLKARPAPARSLVEGLGSELGVAPAPWIMRTPSFVLLTFWGVGRLVTVMSVFSSLGRVMPFGIVSCAVL